MYKIIDIQEKLERIDTLVRMRATGSPNKLAERLGISKSTLFEYLAFMKELGADIYYDTNVQSYCYKNKVVLQLLSVEKCDDKELDSIKGGKKYFSFSLSPIFSD